MRRTSGTARRNPAADPSGAAEGYLTVFLSLSLAIILSLILTLVEGARMNAVRMQIEYVTEIAVNSCLAEFHRELQRRYDLFFIDTSYGSGISDTSNLCAHLEDYCEKNFSMAGIGFQTDRRDLTELSAEETRIDGTRMICDHECQALREQILAYMTGEPVGELASEVLQLIGSYNGITPDLTLWQRKRDEVISALTQNDLEDPAAEVEGFRMLPVLMQIFSGDEGISQAAMDIRAVPSHRSVMGGEGAEADNSHHYSQADTVLFDEYILEKCSRYGHELDKSVLKYQAEYILFGESCDAANLEKMAQHLLLFRLAVNTAYLFQDQAKRDEAETLAAAVSLVLLSLELKDLIAAAILLAWAYIEAVHDLKVLFHGGKVPLLKDAESWSTSVQNIFSPASEDSLAGSGEGISYDQYLRIFLFLENGNMKNRRLLDMMETDLRKTPGNAAFCIDGCLDTFSVHMRVCSAYGYSYTIDRAVTYD